ncbi:signal peptide peptidase SppA [archaeon]|nr:signal peptide peptidase SppA [archaeon]
MSFKFTKKRKLILVLVAVMIFLGVVFTTSSPVRITGSASQDKIAVIPITGPITISTLPSPLSIASSTSFSGGIIAHIDNADRDNSVKAIIFEINSPGGTVVASKEIADRITKLNKPTVALVREAATSGAYWVASAADVIVADPLSVTGSLGVTGSYVEFSGLLDEYDVDYVQLTTGEFKDTGTPFRDLTSREREIMETKLDIIHEYFITDVARKRKITDENIRKLDSGIFYLGLEAEKLGLVDMLGDKDSAVQVAKDLAKIKDAKVTTYEEKRGLVDFFLGAQAESVYYFGRGFGDAFYSNQIKSRNSVNLQL